MIRFVSLAVAAALMISAAAIQAQECGDLDNSGRIAATDALLLLSKAVDQPVPDLVCPIVPVLPATGQTTCHDTAGAEIECAGTGQDGELQKGAPRSFTDNGDGTVTDDVTGLMWEKLSDDASIHDRDNVYSWDDAFTMKVAALNSTSFAGHGDWRVPNSWELETLVNLDTTTPALYSAFNASCAPACTVLTCSCPNAYSWSSTTYVFQPWNAWWVDFNGGSDGVVAKLTEMNVRAVRSGFSATATQVQECGDLDNSGQIAANDALLLLNKAVGQPVPDLACPALPVLPATGQTACYDTAGAEIECAGTGQDGELQKGAPRSFTDNGDGTVTDDVTRLMWEKLSDDGSIHDQDNEYNWDGAFTMKLATLNSTSFAGHNDWRAPNRSELKTLVSWGTTTPATFSSFNTSCAPACTVLTCSCPNFTVCWSSSTTAFQWSGAWYIGLNFGDSSWDHKLVGVNLRAVRGGS